MSYFYFTYFLDVPESGVQRKDDAVVASVDEFFPIGNVQTCFKEEFGDNAKITILNVIEISGADYNEMAERIGWIE